jgi:hypothetical protein
VRKRERDFLMVLINAKGSAYPPILLRDFLLFLIPEILEPQGKGKVTIGYVWHLQVLTSRYHWMLTITGEMWITFKAIRSAIAFGCQSLTWGYLTVVGVPDK